MKNDELKKVAKEVAALAKKAAGKSGKLSVSPETAALLERVTNSDAAATPTTAPTAILPTKTESASPVTKAPPSSEPTPPTPSVEPPVSTENVASAKPRAEVYAQETAPADRVAADDGLAHIAAEVAVCEQCPLWRSRNRPVPGEGNPKASLVFVGEAPGADEDKQGRPFVGRAGGLLTDIIVKGMNISRDDVFICNVLKCRPPNNRTPSPDEVIQCEPYLLRQLTAIRPKVICALGATAAQTLLKTTSPIRDLRGSWHDYHGIPFRVTYHPAYLLRDPSQKRKTWEDIQEIMRLLAGEITPDS